MPHAALWVVQRSTAEFLERNIVFQCRTRLCGWYSLYGLKYPIETKGGSMPHAALWVVQHVWYGEYIRKMGGFNAARGFVGGATQRKLRKHMDGLCFNAARGFVCGAAPAEIFSRLFPTGFNAARGFVGGAALLSS